MLKQLLNLLFHIIKQRYSAALDDIFELVAIKKKIDFYNKFTRILIINGVQKAFSELNDEINKNSAFYKFLGQIASLSLMSRSDSLTEGEKEAPFIMTCVTATHFGPIPKFLADSHRKRVYLPLKRLEPPN